MYQADFVADLRFGDFGDGFPVIAHGGKEDDHVVDGTSEDTTDEDPKGARQVTELSRNDRTDQGAGAGNSREVMAEDDVLVGRHVVVAVFKTEGRCDFILVNGQYFCGNKSTIETVSQYKY